MGAHERTLHVPFKPCNATLVACLVFWVTKVAYRNAKEDLEGTELSTQTRENPP
jgi:hypothetical protein